MSSSADRAHLGRAGEDAAWRAYERNGYSLVARNWRCKAGELDIVAERGDMVVFCEVKTRSGSGFGAGFEAVTVSKQARLRRLAELFLYESRLRPQHVRFDVASVLLPRRGNGFSDVQIFDDAF